MIAPIQHWVWVLAPEKNIKIESSDVYVSAHFAVKCWLLECYVTVALFWQFCGQNTKKLLLVVVKVPTIFASVGGCFWP